jgi:hypothetical protein
MAGETTYCDDYEAITGKTIPIPDGPVIETKVVAAPKSPKVAPATVAETA